MAVVDREGLERILPHRGRALLPDIVDVENSLGLMTVTEKHCEGHFPGNPIFPGKEMIEFAAQVLAVLALQRIGSGEGFLTIFGEVGRVRFRKRAVPGDQICCRVTILLANRRLCRGDATLFVGDSVIAELYGIVGVLVKAD